ncbi:carboxylesterase/lipase family protein [Myxococcota bacterium]|nr:carboxylesterase/lipase family protein [Myxococcota bacterium]
MTIASTTSGPVEGYQDNNLHVFKGIPYAAPPLGERRWLPPIPHAPWSEVRPAQRYGPVAPQRSLAAVEFLSAFRVGDDIGEDCLTLNVWTPGLDDARRAVMVWIHGGAFVIGAGSQTVYDGAHLAAKGDLVVVTINYRLGALGFLNLNESTGGRIPSTGNEGLLDQGAALAWVRDNIANFGGDPANVTIFGESAGGMSVGCHLAMPTSQGLFHKAIPQSGACHTSNPKEKAVQISQRFLERVGVDASQPDALRAVSADRILEVQSEMADPINADPELGGMPFQPCIDGVILPARPIDAVRDGSAAGVPVLVGSTLDEWKLLGPSDPTLASLDAEGLEARLSANVGTAAAGVAQTYTQAVGNRGVDATPSEVFIAIETDRIFRLPALQLAEAQRAQNTPAYNYLFTWKSPAMGGMLGACHALELCFVFGTIDLSESRPFAGSGPECDALEGAIQDAWIAFARSGDPSVPALGRWPVYGPDRETMILGASCGLEKAPFETERAAWDDLVVGAI